MCLMNERKTGENGAFDIQSRVENLLWAVSGDYGMDMAADVKAWEKSPYIPLYEAVVQGIFRKYFDREKYQAFFARKVYQGMIPSVLEALGRLCIDSAVWKKAVRERPGVENLRKTAFQDILEKDSLRLTHTDLGYLEKCYLRKAFCGEKFQGRTEKILDKIAAIEDTDSVEDICRCLEEIYWEAYENRLAENFKGLDREVKSSDRDMKEYIDKEKAREEEKEEEEESPVNIFSGHVDPQDNGKQERPRSSMILLDRESSDKMEEYIIRSYGERCIPARVLRELQQQVCTGTHKDCRLHITRGILHGYGKDSTRGEYVKKVRGENLRALESTKLITRQNIQTLANTMKRALLTRSEKETLSSEYGRIQVNKLWNLGRTRNRKLFSREIRREDTDFAVEILIDASGSQQGRQSQVALQGYILSAALSIAGIPHQVTGFCTLGAYTILTLFRDFDEDRELDQRILEFYGSANNLDGLAIKAAAAGLDQRKEENKILILLSDGRPNDIMAGSQNPGYTLPGAKKPEKEPYCLDFALRDTAGEIRKLRNRKIAVLGVFAGEEEDLAAEKKIFGKDFAYIRDLSNFANVVGRYLKKQILELL